MGYLRGILIAVFAFAIVSLVLRVLGIIDTERYAIFSAPIYQYWSLIPLALGSGAGLYVLSQVK